VQRNREALFLPKSPLVFVLGVVHFDPILAIGDYVAGIQESLRKKGFPKVRERMIPHRIEQTEGQELRVEMKKQWEFHNPENRTSIMADREAVAVQTTDYTTFEAFHETLELALACVADHLEVSEVLRCGLRYIDIVDQPAEGDIIEWVNPGLLGLPRLDEFQRKHSHSLTEMKSEDGTTMVVKATLVPEGIVLPPDLLPCDLAFGKNPVRSTPFVLLDLDHFSRKNFTYDREATLRHLSMLHDGLDRVFRNSVTPHALEQWKQP
jgi:uncharacterized protein (TIGR04255 family)